MEKFNLKRLNNVEIKERTMLKFQTGLQF